MNLLSRLDNVRKKNADLSGEEVEASPPEEVGGGLKMPENMGTVGANIGHVENLSGEKSDDRDDDSERVSIFSATSGSAGDEPDEFVPSNYNAAGEASSDSIPDDMPDHQAREVPLDMPDHPEGETGLRLLQGQASEGTADSDSSDAKAQLYRDKHKIFDEVLGAIDPRLWQEAQRDEVEKGLKKTLDQIIADQKLELDARQREWMLREFVQEIHGFGPLTPFLNDPGISKINVDGANNITIEQLGQTESAPVSFRDNDHLLSIIRRIAEVVGGRIDPKVPLLDRPLPDGARVRAKVPPLAPEPSLSIEKSTSNPFEAVTRQRAARAQQKVQPYHQLRERIQQRLLRDLEANALDVADPDKLRTQVEEMITDMVQEERIAMTRAERASLVTDLLNEIIGLGPLEPLLNDPDVDEIMVNGPNQIYVERRGKLEVSQQRFRDNAHVMQIIDRVVAPLGRRIDEKSPMVDGRLRDGSRFNAIIPPLALSGPTITIRKFARDPYSMTDLINFKSITREAAQFMQAAVASKLNIIVSGGTGSGKTTTLNVLSGFIPSNERILTIEDAAELQMRQDHVIRLETRPANIEGAGEIAIRDLVRNALRMRPDRIVVGECRGAEALDMLQAMNTGHDGSLTTLHSNGPRDTLKRLETMVLMSGYDLPIRAIREQISMAVHLILHQERMSDGIRRVSAISEIVGMESDIITLQDIFKFHQQTIDENGRIVGALVPTGLRPKAFETMIEHGIHLPADIFMPRIDESTNDVRKRVNDRRISR